MYIFGYKITVFIQNLYFLVKYFGKNFIFSVKSNFFFVFFRTKCTFLGTKLQFLSKICTFLSNFFGKNFNFRVKSTNFLFFQDQMYIFGYKTTVFIQNLYILVKLFGKNFIFRVKSTIFFVFSRPNVHLCVQNYTFYPKFVHFSEFFWQKLHF